MGLTLFSRFFGINPEDIDSAELLDIYLEADTPLFIDPLLISKSTNEIVRTEGLRQFHNHFEKVIRLLSMSENESDPAWKAAEKLLSLKEPAENGLGYGRRQRAGSARSANVRKNLLRTIKQVISLGSKDPEMLSLMGFLEKGIGSDTISDFTTFAMVDALAEVSNKFCIEKSIKVQKTPVSVIPLPIFERKGKKKPVLLIPRDILRDLPVTDGWRDVWEAAEHNRALREKLSIMLSGIAKPTITEQKKAIKAAVTQSGTIFEAFLEAVKSAATSYDPNDDVRGFYTFRQLLITNPIAATGSVYEIRKKPEEVLRLMKDAAGVFQHHVENGNLWEALWAGNQPKLERAAQLIFFAISDAYCRAHGVDVVSEPNFGGGPVDFAFGDGCNSKVLVEIKRSLGTVVAGYEKQLERYKKAARTDFALFIVINYGGAEAKIRKIQKIRDAKLDRGERAADIIIIDARKRVSPSKIR